MTKKLHRVLAIALALMMAIGLASNAFAVGVGGQIPNQGSGVIGAAPAAPARPALPPPTDKDIEIMFHGGKIEQGELNVLPTELDAFDKYHVTIDRAIPVPPAVIPGTITTDRYYTQIGWVLEDDFRLGNHDKLVDMTTYIPQDEDTFYAIYRDTWPLYSDMKQDRSDWFYQYVRDLSIDGVVNGYPGNIFKPQGNVTWGEALKLIMLATGYEAQPKTGEHWASGYLTRALADGLVTDETIDLAEPITRLEYAQVAARAMELPRPTITSPFVDTSDREVTALYVAGIVEGNFNAAGDRRFNPSNNITRAEISAVIWRINEYYSK